MRLVYILNYQIIIGRLVVTDKLLFVYNANSGVVSTLSDYFIKIIKPQTYKCRLCSLTFGNLGMKSEWRQFVRELNRPVQFLHRDEFRARYPNVQVQFPSAFIKNGSELTPFLTREEINGLKTLEELMELVGKKDKARKSEA